MSVSVFVSMSVHHRLFVPSDISFKKLVTFWEDEMKWQRIPTTEKLQKQPMVESKEPLCF